MVVWVVVWLLTRSPVALLLAHPELPPIVGLAPRSAQALLVLAVPLDEVQAFWQAATPAPPSDALPVSSGKSFSPLKAQAGWDPCWPGDPLISSGRCGPGWGGAPSWPVCRSGALWLPWKRGMRQSLNLS
jgi:hypothetical protein